jgi:hypothetical protein
LVVSAALLIRERGAHATAISDVLEHSARGYLLSRPIHDIAESGHAEDYDTCRANETNA